LYKSEQQSAHIMSVFSLLSVLICCLGLFGLAAFAAEQRTKEIGVRKVLGASVLSIARLLNRDFVRMMLLATVLGAPIAYYFLNGWLANFTYHIQLEWWMFVAAGAVATVIAVATVSLQSIKAALANPVKSLRNE
jgi:putative ABC transport system permease protein